MKSVCPGGSPTVSLLPWTGAGPYPQTYHFDDPAERDRASLRKEKMFRDNYENYCEALDTGHAIPFAGQYVRWTISLYESLSGKSLMRRFCGYKIWWDFIRSADGGDAQFDLDTMSATSVRTEPYDYAAIDQYLEDIDFKGYHTSKNSPPRRCSANFSAFTAYYKALAKRPTKDAWWICIGQFIRTITMF